LDPIDQKDESEELNTSSVDTGSDGHCANIINRCLNSGESPEKSKFEVSTMPGARLLSVRERKLCNSIKLRPTQYITLKTLILKVSV